MVNTLLLVGSADRQLEDFLRGVAAQVSRGSTSDLTRLTADSAPVPDVVVLDVRQAGSMPAACTAFHRAHPDVGIVIIARALDPALLLDAMRAGVNEVVSEPLTEETVGEAVGRVTANRGLQESGKVYGFIGAKGGVGTTTVAVNMAFMIG